MCGMVFVWDGFREEYNLSIRIACNLKSRKSKGSIDKGSNLCIRDTSCRVLDMRYWNISTAYTEKEQSIVVPVRPVHLHIHREWTLKWQ